jgi:hypothetical protein
MRVNIRRELCIRIGNSLETVNGFGFSRFLGSFENRLKPNPLTVS